MKECPKCKEIKSLDEFSNDKTKKSGKQTFCKLCRSKYWNTNPSISTSSEYRKNYYRQNKKAIVEKQKLYFHNNESIIKEYQRNYRNHRRRVDISFKLTEMIRTHIHRVFNLIGTKKILSSLEIVDFTPQELKNHIEALFTSEMSWDNHGLIWELDHIKPIKWFITNSSIFKNNMELCKAANTLENLQPLLKHINRSKSSNYS